MALFDASLSKAQSVAHATEILTNIRAAYAAAKLVNDLLVLYRAGGDPAFVAAINAVFTAAEKAKLGAVAGHFAALVTELEANHTVAIGKVIS